MSGPKTLSGTIKTPGTVPSDTILFSFERHTYILVSSSTCQPFVTTSATLTYNSDDQLTGDQHANGTVGTSVNFTFENGPIAVGTLEKTIAPQCKPDGKGTWNKGE